MRTVSLGVDVSSGCNESFSFDLGYVLGTGDWLVAGCRSLLNPLMSKMVWRAMRPRYMGAMDRVDLMGFFVGYPWR